MADGMDVYGLIETSTATRLTSGHYVPGGGRTEAIILMEISAIYAGKELNTMKDLIHYIAQSLVDHPEHVTVSEVEGNQTTVLELKVAKDDLGKVIGKQGRTAQAMRTILSAVSSKEKKRTVLEIIE